MKKRGQFNFVWIFAILAGIAILFLAIYGSLKGADTTRNFQDSSSAKSLSILTDPLSSGFGDAQFGSISFLTETRIRNFCFEDDLFGRNEISVATKSGVGNEYNDYGIPELVKNKYIFSEEEISGESFFVFSKPFNFPYKVNDVTYISSKNYCFVNPFEEIKRELNSLNIPNLEVESTDQSCDTQGALRVCFNIGTNCDITVFGDDEKGVVKKGSEELRYYSSALLYAAIFSDKEVYECNVKRLMKRSSKIAEVLYLKANFMSLRGCNTNLESDLRLWSAEVYNASILDLIPLGSASERINLKNDGERICFGLW